MATARINDKLARSIKPGASVRDAEVKGLELRVNSDGTRSWLFRYRSPKDAAGKQMQRAYRIGGFPDWGTARARIEAGRLYNVVRAGGDPLADIRREVAEKIEREHREKMERAARQYTVRKAAEAYIERNWLGKHERLKADPHNTFKRFFAFTPRGSDLPLGDWPLADVTRAALVEWHDFLRARGKPAAANKDVVTASRFFRKAAEREEIPANPMPPWEQMPQRDKNRRLTRDELRDVWHACDALGYPLGPLVRLLMLTGQRPGQFHKLRWIPDPEGQCGHVDLKAGRIVWPHGAMKKRAASAGDHVLPLTPTMRALLTACPRHLNDPRVFIAPGQRGVKLYGGVDRIARKIHEASGTSDWTLHALRHSWASEAEELDALPDRIVEQVQAREIPSRQIGEAGRRYRHALQPDELLPRLQAFEDHLRGIVGDLSTSAAA